MLWELERHDWSALRVDPSSAATRLPGAIRDLIGAQEKTAAEDAYFRIHNCAITEGELYEAAVATASGLTIGLTHAAGFGRLFALDCLYDIAQGESSRSEAARGRTGLQRECILEIAKGLASVLAVFEETTSWEEIDSCAGIIGRCGMALPELRPQCRWYIERWLHGAPTSPTTEAVRSWLDVL